MLVTAVSDLHLEFCEQGHGVPNLGSSEILILGGDILCARHFKKEGKLKQVYLDFLNKCSDNFKHVLYVIGNHEPFSYNWEGTWEVLKEYLPPKIKLIENDYVEIVNYVFLGCTLWTDFHKENPLVLMEAGMLMNEYKCVRITSKYRKLNPNDTLAFHKQSIKFLKESVEKFKDKNIWIFTHHGPSYQSVHEKYKNFGVANSCFVSDLDDFILNNPQIKYFSHGHTHESFDYMIGNCRVICNPRGYYTGVNSNNLNQNFNPNLQIEL